MNPNRVTLEIKEPQSNTYTLLGWGLLLTYIIIIYCIPFFLNFLLGFIILPIKWIMPIAAIIGFLYGIFAKKSFWGLLAFGILLILIIVTAFLLPAFNDFNESFSNDFNESFSNDFSNFLGYNGVKI